MEAKGRIEFSKEPEFDEIISSIKEGREFRDTHVRIKMSLWKRFRRRFPEYGDK
jgi:hypothetical protein